MARYRIKVALDLARESDYYGMGQDVFVELISKEFDEADIKQRVEESHPYSTQPDLMGDEDWLRENGNDEWWIPSGWIEEIK